MVFFLYCYNKVKLYLKYIIKHHIINKFFFFFKNSILVITVTGYYGYVDI